MTDDIQNALESSRFYGILDSGYVSPRDWIEKYDGLANGGAGVIQVRAKKESATERYELLSTVIRHRAESSVSNRPLLIINDDLELCLQFDDIGLHVGQDDTPPIEARLKLGPSRALGLSTHSIAQSKSAMDLPKGTLNYFAVGPVFATQTKPSYEAVGLSLVKWVASQEPEIPFFCIGGINRNNVDKVRESGGAQVVAVSDALCDPDTSQAVASFTKR